MHRLTTMALSGLGATLILGSAVFYIIDQSERERERERENDTELLVDKTAPTAPTAAAPPSFSEIPGEEIINTAKPPDLIEQPLDAEGESFAVLATKLDLDNHIYQLAFTLANTSDQDKDFYLIPVSLGPQTRFQGIKGNLRGGSARWNFDSGWSFDQAKHKQELLPALAQAYDDIDNNNYTGNPVKLTLTPKTTLIAQSEWALKNPNDQFPMTNQTSNPNDPTFVETTAGRQNSKQNALKPVYFLVYGSAGGVKDELTILNVHSHPLEGENWTVSFETKGKADLTITPQDQATIDDDDFTGLYCNDQKLNPQILEKDVIYYPNWQCDGEGKVVHYTKKSGTHTLKFQFGDETDYAYNSVNNVWSSTGSTDCNLDANWSLGHVPTTGEIAYFDVTSVVACTFSGAITADGITTMATYTGAINLNGQTFTLGSGGMVLDNGAGSTFVLGAATIGITGGPLDNKDSTGWNANTSTITLNGSSTVTSHETYGRPYTLIFAAGSTITIPNNTRTDANNSLQINGAVVFGSSTAYLGVVGGAMSLNSGASFSGAGALRIRSATSGNGLVTLHSSVTTPIIYMPDSVAGTRLAAGTYTGKVYVYSLYVTNTILQLDAGSYAFNGGLTVWSYSAGKNFTLANNTNGPTISVTNLTVDIDNTGNVTINDAAAGAVNWTITGNVVDERTGAGTFTWTKGTGTITASGSSAQNWDLMDKTVEDIVVNKSSGTLTLSGGVITDSFTGTAGTFDPNGQTIETTGDFTTAAGFVTTNAADVMNGSAITVGGNLSLTGQAGTLLRLLATAPWTLKVTGTAVAHYVEAAYSNAFGGTEIDATDNGVSGGDNGNWNFLGNVPLRIKGGVRFKGGYTIK